MRVLIVGAGPGGLTLASALAKKGVRSVVLERSPALVESSCFGIADNGALCAKAIGIHAALEPHISELKRLRFQTSSGKQLVKFTLAAQKDPEIPKHGLLKRHSYCSAVLEQLPKDLVDVKFGANVVDISQTADSVDVFLQDGRKINGSILVGADGVHSRVREHIFPIPQSDLTWSGYRLTYGLTDALALPSEVSLPEPNTTNMIYGTNFYGLLTNMIASNELYWAIYERQVEPDDPDAWKDKPRTLEENRDRLLDVLPIDTDPKYVESIRFTKKLVETTHWLYPEGCFEKAFHKGRIAIMGDAAHKTMPFTGQGLNMAVVDALVLTTKICENIDKTSGILNSEKAFQEYHSIRYPISKATIEGASKFGKFQLPDSSVFRGFRNSLLGIVGALGVDQWLYNKTAEKFENDKRIEVLKSTCRKYDEAPQQNYS